MNGPAAKTDAEGHFLIQGLRHEDLVLSVAAIAAVAGVILNEDGGPIEGASVRAQPEGAETVSGRLRSKTEADDRFRLEGLVVDRAYRVEIRMADHVPWKIKGVKTGADTLRITLSTGEMISGRLEVPEGQEAKGRRGAC